MDPERFDTYIDSLLDGCLSRLAQMEQNVGDDNVDQWKWYGKAHNELTSITLQIQIARRGDSDDE